MLFINHSQRLFKSEFILLLMYLTPQFKIPFSEIVFSRLTTMSGSLSRNKTSLLFVMQNLNISSYPGVYHDLGHQMLFGSQLISFWLTFLTQNPVVSGWTNEKDNCLLSVYFENQIDIQNVYNVFQNVLLAGYIRLFLQSQILSGVMTEVYNFQAQYFYFFNKEASLQLYCT